MVIYKRYRHLFGGFKLWQELPPTLFTAQNNFDVEKINQTAYVV
jgi:hypothetical protein